MQQAINKVQSKNLSELVSDKYDEWLANYQEDIKRIIGKYRKQYHRLDPDEIASQANLSLIKYKEKILSKYEGEFDYNAFQKIAFTYVKNIIGWSHYAEDNKKYVKNRLDMVHESEDGPLTTFELSLATQGYEEESIANLFNQEKYKAVLDVITKYYDILTENDVKIISMMQKGMNEEQMSLKLDVTRQAVNFAIHNIRAKITSFIRAEHVFNNSYETTVKGKNAINNFFDTKGRHGVAQEHSKFLKNTVLSKPYKYTVDELVEMCNAKFATEYRRKQISCSLSKRKLYNFVAKERKKNKTLERT